jgi:hypothetical protein
MSEKEQLKQGLTDAGCSKEAAERIIRHFFPEADPEKGSPGLIFSSVGKAVAFFDLINEWVGSAGAAQEKMDMVRHQAVAVKAKVPGPYGFRQDLKKGLMVFFVPKEGRLGGGLKQDMGDRGVQERFLSEGKEEGRERSDFFNLFYNTGKEIWEGCNKGAQPRLLLDTII